ncbi:MAG TPA: Spy/CpxP family protein refolding chaperone [Flavisolibacter sp.]
MKKIIASALVLALSIGAAQAQKTEGQDKKHKKEMHQKHHAKELNLTDEQKQQMKSLHEAQRQEMEALRANTSLTKEQQKAKRTEIHEKYRSQFAAILTPAQKQQMEQMKAARKAKMSEGKKMKQRTDADFPGRGAQKGKMDRRGTGEDGEKMAKELNLTAAQQEQVKQIRTSFRSQMETLRKDESLSREEKRTKMQELMKQQEAQVRSVLTKEQIEKLEARKKEMMDKRAEKMDKKRK